MTSLLRPLRVARLSFIESYRSFATVAEAVSDLPTTPTASSSTTEPTISEALPPGIWTPYTQRSGVIARKRGMTALWDRDGKRWPVTVLQVSISDRPLYPARDCDTEVSPQVDACQVVRHTPAPANSPNLHSLQLGASDRPEHTTSRPQLGHFAKAGVPPKYNVQEFRVTEDAVLPVGTELSAGHFVPGQCVDVTATS